MKRIMASVEPILILHPPGVEENVKKPTSLHVENLACGFGNRQIEKCGSSLFRVGKELFCQIQLYAK